MKLRCLLAVLVFPLIYWASTPPAAAATATFNFDADPIGKATPFVDTNNGAAPAEQEGPSSLK
jgi:hypothetical protein